MSFGFLAMIFSSSALASSTRSSEFSARAFWIWTFSQSGEVLIDIVEGRELEIVALGAVIGLGERDLGERKIGLKVERELQEDDAHVESALAGEGVADAVEHLGESVGRIGDEQRRGLAGLDVGEQRLDIGCSADLAIWVLSVCVASLRLLLFTACRA